MTRKHSTRLSQAHDEPEDEGQHTAARDYPELGTILDDRPDPGRQIRVIGSRTAAAYGTEDDARNSDYNGGEGDLGMDWAEPANQDWVHENIGPQEEAPPPPWAMSPVMARLFELEEAAGFFGREATTINGTQVDDAGDAPEHGTIPRAEDPDSYDDRSEEGSGDDKWNEALPWGDKKNENAATVGMYPEGISSGNGPGISVGPFTASISDEDYAELHQHMLEDHGYEGSRTPNDFWRISLPHRHSTEHFEGNADHYHPEDYEFDPDWEDHGGHGGYHEFTGMRREARVPWTGEERGSLHRWQVNPPGATWGDFVNSAEFLDSPAERSNVRHEEDGEGIGVVEATSDRQWELHLRRDHGWDDASFQRQRQQGNQLRDMHAALHEAGLASHQHAGGPEQAAQEARNRAVTDRFGFDPGFNRNMRALIQDRAGGAMRSDHEHRLVDMSEPAIMPRHPDEWAQVDPARFRRMMSALDAPHAHDDDSSPLDAGAVEGDEGFPGPHEDGQSPWRTAASSAARSDLIRQLREDYPPEALEWIRHARVTGPHLVPLEAVDWSGRGTWTSYKQPRRCGAFMETLDKKASQGKHLKPVLIVAAGNEQPFIADGHHRSIVQLLAAAQGQGRPGIWAYTARVKNAEGPWDDMHDRQLRATSRNSTKRVSGPDAPPREVKAFQRRVDSAVASLKLDASHTAAFNVHVRIDGKELASQEHDDEDNSLDYDKDKTPDSKLDKNGPEIESSQVDDDDSLDSPADIPGPGKPGGKSSAPADAGGFPPGHPMSDPANWPSAGAGVNERERAYTQGSDDGKVKRGAPAPDSFSPDDGDSGGGGDQGDGDQPDDDSTPFSKDAALCMFAAAAGNREFRFEFTATWHDVMAKAKRIRAEGHVRITHASAGMVIGEVRGDHDIYESGIQRPVGKRSAIQHWACGCPWASYHQDKSYGGRYAGRPCSHVMALQFEAQSRGMFGRPFDADGEPAAWSPPTVVVKSMPPYEGEPHRGRWREQWRAPLAHLERDGAPCQRATAVLARAGADRDEIGALRLLAGLRATADQANAPWGSDNVSEHPAQKPYGATSPPDKDTDPGSYGPLSAPDPANWGGIDQDSAFQMPLTNTAAHQVLVPGAPRPVPGDVDWPGTAGWQQEDQGTFGFTDQAPTAGPSTAMNPRDPQGIRMEEVLASGTPYPFRDTVPQLDGALAELHDRPEPALPSTTGDEEQAEGEARRIQAGIDGTMGDAQDVPHQFTASSLHDGCALCGLAPLTRAHAAADGTIGGGSAGTGEGVGAPLDTAALGEFGASYREASAMGDQGIAEGLSGGGQDPSPVGQEPGMGSADEYLTPDDQSIQTIGNQQWSGGGADSDEVAVPAGQPQGGIDDIVAAFQRSAAARGYSGASPARSDGDIALAARQYLTKTADVLPQAEAEELIREGRGERARNLNLLRLEGTHYEEEDSDLARRGISMDDYDDDVISA